MVDYATLLTKYITYIADCEGIDYIEPIDLQDESAVIFTAAAWQAFQAIHVEQARGTVAPTEVVEVWSLPDDPSASQPARGAAKDDYYDG